MISLWEALIAASAQLAAAQVPDSRLDAEYLLCHVLGMERMELRLHARDALSPAHQAAYNALISQRALRIPLQHLLGTQPFYGRSFWVTPDVLIPRPETELLCEHGLAALQHYPQPARVLDLCCGSGAIAVTMALESGAETEACDLSAAALTVSRKNAQALNADIRFYQGDLFEAVGDRRYHVILSNPPYIPQSECAVLQPEVLREPLMALDGGADGLAFYRRIAAQAPDHLLPGGTLLLEVGMGQAPAVKRLLAGRFQTIQVFQDFQHIDRMVQATL